MRLTEKNCLKKQIGNDLLGIEWLRDQYLNATLKGQGHDPQYAGPNISKTATLLYECVVPEAAYVVECE